MRDAVKLETDHLSRQRNRDSVPVDQTAPVSAKCKDSMASNSKRNYSYSNCGKCVRATKVAITFSPSRTLLSYGDLKAEPAYQGPIHLWDVCKWRLLVKH